MAMNQLEHDKGQQDVNQAAAPAAAERVHHPAYYAVQAMLENGVHDSGRVAKLLRQHPEAKAEVFKLLHQTLGNRFASQVEDLVNLEDSPSAAEPKMPSHGTAKSRANAADSMQDFAEINRMTPAERKGETAAQAGAGLRHEDAHENAGAVAQATSKLGITMPGPAQNAPASDAAGAATAQQTKVAASAETTNAAVERKDLLNSKPSEAESAVLMDQFEKVNASGAKSASNSGAASAATANAAEAGSAAGGAAAGKAAQQMNASNFTKDMTAADHAAVDPAHWLLDDGPKGGAAGKPAQPMTAANFTKEMTAADHAAVDPAQWLLEDGPKGGAAANAGEKSAAAAQAPAAAQAKQEVAPPAKNDPEPAAQGPAPAPTSAAAKNEEPAPEVAQQAASPAPVAANGPEAAPKNDDKAAVEKGKEEKPEEKADGLVKITASALRVRAQASLKGAILGKLPRGTQVKTVGHEGAWLKIEWPGAGIAFIHSKYTSAVKGNEGGEEEEQGEHESQEQKQQQERPKQVANSHEQEQNEHEDQQNERV